MQHVWLQSPNSLYRKKVRQMIKEVAKLKDCFGTFLWIGYILVSRDIFKHYIHKYHYYLIVRIIE